MAAIHFAVIISIPEIAYKHLPISINMSIMSSLQQKKTLQDQTDSQMPYLYYPPIRGVAQPVRNLFYYLDVEFEEIAVQNSRQIQAGFNSGYPKLAQGQDQLTDAIPIFRHLCRAYGRLDLLGLTPQNRAVINQFLFHYADIRTKIVRKIAEGAKSAYGKTPGEIYEIKVNILKFLMQQQCRTLKDFLQMHMKNKSWLFGYLTITDFFFYQLAFYILNFLELALKNSLIYRNFESFVRLFESQEFYQKNKAKIMSKKIFMPFKDKEVAEIMVSFWNGDKEFLL